MPRPVAVLLLLLCTMLWGFGFIAQKSAMQVMGPLTFSAVRYIMAAFLVAPLVLTEFCRRRNGPGFLSRNQWFRLSILSIAFFLGVILQQVALQTASATNGGFLTSLYVIMTPMIVYFTSRTHPHPVTYPCALLALVGIYLLAGADFHLLTYGDYMLIACALGWAVQVAMLGPLVQETRMPIAISALSFLTVGVFSGLCALWLENSRLADINAGWVELAYAGVLSTALAFSLQAIGQQYVPPGNAAVILSTEALFAALGGALFFHERLGFINYIGAALIFVAVFAVEFVPTLKKAKSV